MNTSPACSPVVWSEMMASASAGFSVPDRVRIDAFVNEHIDTL